jgi:hypothetical protein
MVLTWLKGDRAVVDEARALRGTPLNLPSSLPAPLPVSNGECHSGRVHTAISLWRAISRSRFIDSICYGIVPVFKS